MQDEKQESHLRTPTRSSPSLPRPPTPYYPRSPHRSGHEDPRNDEYGNEEVDSSFEHSQLYSPPITRSRARRSQPGMVIPRFRS